MGFFKDFKRDFAQAVNELIPEKDELAGEYDDEDMVNTFDEADNMEIAPEDILEDIDDYERNTDDEEEDAVGVYADLSQERTPERDEGTGEHYAPVEFDSFSGNGISQEEIKDVPEAEVIAEHDLNSLNEMDNQENEEPEEAGGDLPQDELKAADALDEADMAEGTEDAESLEGALPEDGSYYGNPFEQMGGQNTELPEMDLLKDIEDVLSRIEAGEAEAEMPETAENEADNDSKENEENIENKDDYAAGELPEADQFREDVMAEVEMNTHDETAAKIDDILEVDTTYITKNTVVRGNIKTDGSVDVLGTVKGTVSCGGKLIIGGFIKGDVDAGDVYANAAKVDGRIVAEGSVKIGVGSIVMGDVIATSAVISGAVNGDIDVHGPVIVDSTAVVMGNIKSRSVQINNGAVIEGFCSQCYSEIDVKSFFDMEIEDDDDEEDQKKNEKIEPEKAAEPESETKPEKEPEKGEPKQDNKQSGKNGRKNNRNKNGNKNKNNSGNNRADRENSTEGTAESVTENAVAGSEPKPETEEKTGAPEETATEDKEAGNE